MLIESGNQSTIKNTVSIKGTGLHCGEAVEVTLKPAPAGTGYLFRRIDLPLPNEIIADPAKVIDTARATTLAEGMTKVMTVEHILAALYLLAVDNVQIEVDGSEIPILDGSAKEYVDLIEKAGIRELVGSPRLVRQVDRPFQVEKGDAKIVVLPADIFRISYAFFAPPPCYNQIVDWQVGDRQPASARTFGWVHEIEALLERGLIRGGSFDCALIFNRESPPPPLRFNYEPAWHKVLDLLGDLALYRPLICHIIALGAGHALHNKLARHLLAQEQQQRSNIIERKGS